MGAEGRAQRGHQRDEDPIHRGTDSPRKPAREPLGMRRLTCKSPQLTHSTLRTPHASPAHSTSWLAPRVCSQCCGRYAFVEGSWVHGEGQPNSADLVENHKLEHSVPSHGKAKGGLPALGLALQDQEKTCKKLKNSATGAFL